MEMATIAATRTSIAPRVMPHALPQRYPALVCLFLLFEISFYYEIG